MNPILKISLISLCVLAPILIWYLSKRPKRATVVRTAGGSSTYSFSSYQVQKWGRLLVGLVLYAVLLGIVSITLPEYWEIWNTPPLLFVLTNAAALLCIILLSFTIKQSYAFWGLLLLAGFMIFKYFPEEIKGRRNFAHTPPPAVTASVATAPTKPVVKKPDVNTEYPGYPVRGSGWATKTRPVKAYLYPPGYDDPTYIEHSGPAVLSYHKNPKLALYDTAVGKNPNEPVINAAMKLWRKYNYGPYDIFSFTEDSIYVEWMPVSERKKKRNQFSLF